MYCIGINKKFCASGWKLTKVYTTMHGQPIIKNREKVEQLACRYTVAISRLYFCHILRTNE